MMFTRVPGYFYYCFFLLLLFIKSIGATMGETPKVLIIGSKPFPEEATATTLDVFATEATLGGEVKRLKKFGEIGVGEPEIVRLTNNSGSTVSRLTGFEFDRYLIKLPFTIHQPFPGTEYQEVVLKITTSNPVYIAYDLEPKRVTKSEKINARYELSPEFEFKEIIGVKLGSASYGIEFERLYPKITAYGVGERSFYWVYEGKAGGELVLGSGATGVGISLRVPKGTKQLTGTISYALEMQYQFMGGFREQPGKTADYDFNWNLPTHN